MNIIYPQCYTCNCISLLQLTKGYEICIANEAYWFQPQTSRTVCEIYIVYRLLQDPIQWANRTVHTHIWTPIALLICDKAGRAQLHSNRLFVISFKSNIHYSICIFEVHNEIWKSSFGTMNRAVCRWVQINTVRNGVCVVCLFHSKRIAQMQHLENAGCPWCRTCMCPWPSCPWPGRAQKQDNSPPFTSVQTKPQARKTTHCECVWKWACKWICMKYIPMPFWRSLQKKAHCHFSTRKPASLNSE